MNNNQTQRLKKVFSEILGISEVPEDLSQKNCTKWDSVAQLNLIIEIEAEFGVMFEPEEIVAMQSFSAVTKTLDAKLSA